VKYKALASLVVLTLLIPSLPVLAVPRVPLLWNRTNQNVTFTICGYTPKYRTNTCDDVTHPPEGYGDLRCDVGTCIAIVRPIGKITRQRVRYTDGMGVTLDKYGVLKAFNYTH
jgi:hypothetical protein